MQLVVTNLEKMPTHYWQLWQLLHLGYVNNCVPDSVIETQVKCVHSVACCLHLMNTITGHQG